MLVRYNLWGTCRLPVRIRAPERNQTQYQAGDQEPDHHCHDSYYRQIRVQHVPISGILEPNCQRPPGRVPACVVGGELEVAQFAPVNAALIQPPFQARQMHVANGTCLVNERNILLGSLKSWCISINRK